MTSDPISIAHEQIAQLNTTQLARFEDMWATFSHQPFVGETLASQMTGTFDHFAPILDRLKSDVDAILQNNRELNEFKKQVAAIAETIEIPEIELPEEYLSELKQLAGFTLPYRDAVKIGRVGTSFLQDPDADYLREQIDAAFAGRPDVLEAIDKITFSEAFYSVVPRESIKVGIKVIIFLVWLSISLYIAGAVFPAAVILQFVGFSWSLQSGIDAGVFAHWVVEKMMPGAEDRSTDPKQ